MESIVMTYSEMRSLIKQRRFEIRKRSKLEFGVYLSRASSDDDEFDYFKTTSLSEAKQYADRRNADLDAEYFEMTFN